MAPWNRHTARVLAAAYGALFAVFGSAHAQTADVTTFHNSNTRAADYVAPSLNFTAAAGVHIDPGFNGTVTGHVYAQPLYWVPPAGGDGRVIVATESNHVVALDATSGTVVWDTTLGPAVPSSELPCGDITPLGITGTPVIDSASGTVFATAQLNVQGAPAALVYRLSLTDGSIVSGWPVDIAAGLAAKGLSFTPNVQGERGALTLLDGKLYVPFGGRDGDCGSYHGWMVGVQLLPPGVSAAWETRAVKGGVWSVGGAAAAEGDLYVATGNTAGTTTFGDGEAVTRLPPSLQASNANPDFFAPANWQSLDTSDLDLGGSTAVPLDTGGRKLIVALGKDGNAYVLDRTNLGGIGGALVVQPVSTGQIRGAPAAWSTVQAGFVAFSYPGSACSSSQQGFTTIEVTGGAAPAVTTAWCAALTGIGSPIVTSTDGHSDRIVWVAGGNGDQRLHGFNATTGAVVFAGGASSDKMSHVRQWATILSANGRLYVPADGRIYAFTP